jgi:hypothetical protein
MSSAISITRLRILFKGGGARLWGCSSEGEEGRLGKSGDEGGPLGELPGLERPASCRGGRILNGLPNAAGRGGGLVLTPVWRRGTCEEC